MAKADVTVVFNPKTGAMVTDVHSPRPEDCDKARRVLEAALELMGLGAEHVGEDDAGPRQVEAEMLPQPSRIRN